MANVNLQRTSWGYGELDRRMLGRTDQPTYKQGLVKMENWLPAKSGAAVMRGGTEQIKAIPTTFEADCIIPLRGGDSPMLGLYNSTDQTFRALKADGTWVGATDGAPAEVTLFDSLTIAEQDADADEAGGYVWTLTGAEKTAAEAFYDLIAGYATLPRISCFKVRLTLAANVQTFSMEGGERTLVDADRLGTRAELRFVPQIPRPDSAIIDSTIAGNALRYLDFVKITRTIAPAPVTTKLELGIHSLATGGRYASTPTFATADIGPWEANGTVTILFNDDPGVLPLWAVEPNVAYDEVVVRLFRPNSDVKVYKITDTTITEDVHDETGKDLVGAVQGGKHASHGSYFEGRIVYGGGRDHRSEIVGSRSVDPLTGDRRYGKWALADTTTTTVEGTDTQLFEPTIVQFSDDLQGGYLSLHPYGTNEARLIDTAFTYDNAVRYLAGIILGHTSDHDELKNSVANTQQSAGMFMMEVGSGDTVGNEHEDGGEAGTSGGEATNTGMSQGDVTGLSNLSNAWETSGRVTIVHGKEELVIEMNNANSGGVTLSAHRPYYNAYTIDPVTGVPVAATASADRLPVGASRYHIMKYDNSDALSCRLSALEDSQVKAFITYVLGLDPRPEPASFTIKLEIGTTSTVDTTTLNSDNAFHWIIDTGTTFAEIRWLQSYFGGLFAGTSAGIVLCELLAPDPNDVPSFKFHSTQSVARKAPLVTPLGILAVSADLTSVYEVVKKRDLTAYSEDRFRHDKIHTIAWQQQPQQRLWVVTEAGKLHVLTIQEENGVNGWAQITHQHSGTCTGVVVTNGDDEDDTVWFLMKYGAQSYVEKYREAGTNLHSNRVFMDSAVKRTVGKQSIAVSGNLVHVGTDFGDPSDVANIRLDPVKTEGVDLLDQQISSMFVGSAAARYLSYIRIFNEITTDATSGGAWPAEFMVAVEFGGAMAADFITDGVINVSHTSPLTGVVTHSVDIPMANATIPGAGSHAESTATLYQLTNVNLGDAATPIATFVNDIRAIYPDGDDVAGSANFTITIGQDLSKVAIPSNLIGVTGKKLQITSARATVQGAAGPGLTTDSATYETIDSPATESFVETNFAYGSEVWVGSQVIGDMELPAIENSISSRIVGSWLGQPSRIPWVVSGVEKAHAVKIGPTYDKLVEYFADTTTLSFTADLIDDFVEPYIWTPSNSAESIAWLAAVRALDGDVASGHESCNLYTVSLTAGGVTESFVPTLMGLQASALTLHFRHRASGTYSNLIGATIGGGAGARYIADVHVRSDGIVRLYIAAGGEAGDAAGDQSLSAAFESGGTITVTRTQPAPLVTGHERRALPGHVTTTEPLVIRKDTPSPCTMTYMVVEATAG